MARARLVVDAGVGDKIHLPEELRLTAEGVWIVDRDVYGRAPSFLGIGAPATCEPSGQRLDHQRHAISLVPMRQPAHGQDRAGGRLPEHLRIVRRIAVGVQEPGVIERLAGRRFAITHAVGRDRR